MENPRVLLVDDEPRVVASLTRALRREPYEIHMAGSGAEALDLLAEGPFGVIVSDHDMPGMSGVELLGKVARQYPNTFRVMLTGHARLEVAMGAINTGHVDRFFTKPVDSRVLASSIRAALTMQELAQQSARLLQVAKDRQRILDRLEKQQPGITTISTSTDGALELVAPAESVDDLLAQMRSEVGPRAKSSPGAS